jgi:Penicillin tolerance protein
MIHNPQVNADLQAFGVKFLQDTHGATLIPFDELKAEDIVLIPAFGTTLEIENKLHHLGIQIEEYNTTVLLSKKSGIVLKRSQRINTPSSFTANRNMKKQEPLFHMLQSILLR